MLFLVDFMNFIKGTIKASPFVGVFAALSDEVLLVPHSVLEKEIKGAGEKLGVRVVKCSIANSSLIGVLGRLFGNKLIVPEIIEKMEIEELERNDVEVMVLKEVMALGNLVALNGNAGIVSPLLGKHRAKEIEEFFGVPMESSLVAGSELAGAALAVTNKGFIVHQNINEKELKGLEKLFKVRGSPTTANYGDRFIGNDVIPNSKGAIVGEMTTPFEMMRIDEGLSGE